mmetsp:Transcript_15964/g.34639  ORF Transcript_15964/g.34639 Transcript_15964/m.34639 type:complete len:298 (-) Transcript_15964:159-1052(-)
MGCCVSTIKQFFQSTPSVPDEIIPDPVPGQNCHFVVKDLSIFNSDYGVYKDEIVSGDDDKNKWLFLNSEGKVDSKYYRIDLENFKRMDPDHPKKGEVLWRCTYNEKPSYKQAYDGDSSSDDEGIGGFFSAVLANPQRHTFHLKFKMETGALLEPIKYGGPPYTLRSKAKGYATRRVYYEYVDGERVKRYDDHYEVKKIKYKIKDTQENTLDEFKLEVKGMESRSDLHWASNAFDVQKTGGFFKSNPMHVYTKGGGDPGLALIMGHYVATELSPQEIVSDYHPDWYKTSGYYSDYESD